MAHWQQPYFKHMTPTYIYESPNGGETVYRRMVGNSTRELYSVSEQQQQIEQQLRREELWQSILDCADYDPVLDDMLKQVETYHTLKNTP